MLNSLQEGLDGCSKLIESLLDRWRERIEPVGSTDKIFQDLAWRDVLDPDRNNGNTLVNRALDLAFDLRRRIGMPRENKDHNLGASDRIDKHLAQSIPGTMSRGAIQHRIPAHSSVAQAASAVTLS